MNPNEQLIQDFYTAFQRGEGERMAAFYAGDAVFSDPAFGTLHGKEIGAMWRMLCARGKDLKVSFDRVHADENSGEAHWEAWYTFSGSGRAVHNVIEASFKFREGKIIQHRDRFSFWRWASMALGPLGRFAGWLPAVQKRVRSRAREGLAAFMQKEGS
jgi:ketosteroid isomerase-like protein